MMWYYHRGGAQMGPVSWQELVVAARSGGLGSGDLVWTDGMAQWQAAATIPGLIPVQAPAAPPPLPPARPAPVPPVQPAYTAPPARPAYVAPAAQPASAVAPQPASAAPAMRPAYARPTPPAARQDPRGWVLVPHGWSGWAVASGYLGLLSVLGYPALASLIVGMIALRDLRKHPEKQGKRRAWFGLIMGALGTIAVAVIVGFHLIANLPEPK